MREILVFIHGNRQNKIEIRLTKNPTSSCLSLSITLSCRHLCSCLSSYVVTTRCSNFFCTGMMNNNATTFPLLINLPTIWGVKDKSRDGVFYGLSWAFLNFRAMVSDSTRVQWLSINVINSLCFSTRLMAQDLILNTALYVNNRSHQSIIW